MNQNFLSRLRYYEERKKRVSEIRSEIGHFLKKYDPNHSTLVLDTTGLSASRHYAVLSELDRANALCFKNVHALSGGIFAYVAYHGIKQGYLVRSRDELAKNFCKEFRKAHFPDLAHPFRVCVNILRKSPPLQHLDVFRNFLSYCFKEKFLSSSVADLPFQFNAYFTNLESRKTVSIAIGDGSGNMSLRDLLTQCMLFPAVYGDMGFELGDATLASDHIQTLKNISKGPALVSTPWKAGTKGDTWFISLQEPKYARRELYLDFFKLLLNIPNPKFFADFSLGLGKV